MRALIGALVVVGCFACGCGDDDGKSAADMSMKVNPDLTVTFGTKTCSELLICAQTCAGMDACLVACGASGTQAAQTKYKALGACAFAGCAGASDGGGAPMCSGPGDSSKTCQDCVTAYAQSNACASELTACETDQ